MHRKRWQATRERRPTKTTQKQQSNSRPPIFFLDCLLLNLSGFPISDIIGPILISRSPPVEEVPTNLRQTPIFYPFWLPRAFPSSSCVYVILFIILYMYIRLQPNYFLPFSLAHVYRQVDSRGSQKTIHSFFVCPRWSNNDDFRRPRAIKPRHHVWRAAWFNDFFVWISKLFHWIYMKEAPWRKEVRELEGWAMGIYIIHT